MGHAHSIGGGPLSLVGTFSVMAFNGMSLDNFSLMALVVATGFVVDDAIVMIENIVRYIEQGKSGREAAEIGARQIGFSYSRSPFRWSPCFSPAVDAWRHRPTVPRVRLGPVDRRRHLDAGITDPDTDDVCLPTQTRYSARR